MSLNVISFWWGVKFSDVGGSTSQRNHFLCVIPDGESVCPHDSRRRVEPLKSESESAVTHDERVAGYADRVIHLQDGKIVG